MTSVTWVTLIIILKTSLSKRYTMLIMDKRYTLRTSIVNKHSCYYWNCSTVINLSNKSQIRVSRKSLKFVKISDWMRHISY